MSTTGLDVRDLRVVIDRRGAGAVPVVDGVSFHVAPGRAYGLVGESGSGKSLTLRAVMALLPPAARISAGELELDGRPLPLTGRRARAARRKRIGMVFQDPLGSLDPVQPVGAQIAEGPRRVGGLSRRRAWERALELLALVGVPDAERRAHVFPHQLSGGLRQRVAIAIALAGEPEVLLCDEPTTALDVTVQAQVLELLDDLRRRLGLAIVFVSHDLAVVRQLCEEIGVMYTARHVETGPTEHVLAQPLHPYTLGLLAAAADLDSRDAPQPIPGSLPEPDDLPAGCTFHPRCSFATAECASARPPLIGVRPDHATACIHYEALAVA